MTDPRPRRGVPERWLLPPAPADPTLAQRFGELPFAKRRQLAATGPEALGERPPDERELIVALARRRLATAWRVLAIAPVLGWLVLMTVWGFGRSTYPAAADAWLLGGLLVGGVIWAIASRRGKRRLRRADAIVHQGGGSRGGGPGVFHDPR